MHMKLAFPIWPFVGIVCCYGRISLRRSSMFASFSSPSTRHHQTLAHPSWHPMGQEKSPALRKLAKDDRLVEPAAFAACARNMFGRPCRHHPFRHHLIPSNPKKTSEKRQNMCYFFQDHCEHVVPVWWFHVVSTGLHTSYSLNILKKMKLKISLALRYEIMALEYPLPLEV